MKRIDPLPFQSLLACLGSAVALAAAPAGAQTVMFESNALDVAAIVDALTPPPDAAKPGRVTRNIIVRPKPAGAPGQNPRTGAAAFDITFATDSTELTPRSRSALDVVAKALASDRLTQFRFAVEGHADPRGSDAYNLHLSQVRAERVVGYLVERHGLDARRLHPIGKGETELARPDVPAAPENRRVTFRTESR